MKRVLIASLFLAACSSPVRNTGVTVYEGARLITGDGSAPIENSAFIVENDRFTSVGRRGELPVPAGAAHVDLTGKTVMPTLVDLHGHLGFQNVSDDTMSKATFTRENLIDHLERLAYHGVGAVVGVADLVSRSDLHGGRENWGDVPLRVREEIIPNAALFRTAGPGIAYPGIGRARPSVASRRPLSGHHRCRSPRRRSGLRPDEARIYQDLGGRPRREKEEADAASLSTPFSRKHTRTTSPSPCTTSRLPMPRS